MNTNMPAMSRDLDMSYDEALARAPEAMQTVGFGILTEIDVTKTLKKKIDVDFQRYIILGTCNPTLAHRALSTDLNVGLLLPCNVIVYELGGNKSRVTMIDPEQALGPFGNDELKEIATEARGLLQKALAEF